MFVTIHKKHRMIDESNIIYNYNTIKQRSIFFQLTFLFSQISGKKLQDCLIEIISFHQLFMFTLTFNSFFNSIYSHNSYKTTNSYIIK